MCKLMEKLYLFILMTEVRQKRKRLIWANLNIVVFFVKHGIQIEKKVQKGYFTDEVLVSHALVSIGTRENQVK